MSEREAPAAPLRFQRFPVDALPEPIRGFVVRASAAIGCDPSFVALPLLAGLASAIGNTRRVQLKRGWTEPAILWCVIVSDSGNQKSPALEAALQSVRERQHDAMKDHRAAMVKYDADVLDYEKALAEWKRSKDKHSAQPVKPNEPTPAECWTGDATTEAVAVLLEANPRGLLLACDELATWFGGFDRYTSGKGADAARWIECFHGRALKVNRKASGKRLIYVPRAAVSITGTIQPGILERAIGSEHRENGLLARLLLAFPPRRMKQWTEAEVDAADELAIATIFEKLYGLQPTTDDDGDAKPVVLPLTPTGKAAWVRFYNEHAAEHADLTGELSAAWSKLEAYAARLALVVHLVRWANDAGSVNVSAVDEVSIAAGVTLARWFGQEDRRVYATLGEPDENRAQRRLVELVERKGGAVTARDLMRGSQLFKTAADAEKALNELVKAGIGRWEHEGPGRQGGHPTKRFALIVADTADVDTTPPHDRAGKGSVNVNAVNTADGPDDIVPLGDDADLAMSEPAKF